MMVSTAQPSFWDVVGHWLANTVAVAIAAYILPGVMIEGIFAALVAAVVLGIVNSIIRPIAILLTLPLTVVTLGLFVLVINAALVLAAAAIVPGFAVSNFWWALLFSVILSIVNGVLYSLQPASS